MPNMQLISVQIDLKSEQIRKISEYDATKSFIANEILEPINLNSEFKENVQQLSKFKLSTTN